MEFSTKDHLKKKAIRDLIEESKTKNQTGKVA
jgi:hypothetical protein